MPPVLHSALPYRPWSDPALARLPGTLPVGRANWLVRDEVFAGQMATRDRLLAERPGEVIAALPGSEAAAQELLAQVLEFLHEDDGYSVGPDRVTRPDGVTVALGDPLTTLARLVQEDLCILEKRGDEHMLTAAALLFPASWTLTEKIGQPLSGIHRPVASYDAALGSRVQRMFDWLRPGEPVWRANWLRYVSPELHHPLRLGEVRPKPPPGEGFLRSERQVIARLPETGALVFAIHTYIVPMEAFAPEDRAAIRSAEELRQRTL